MSLGKETTPFRGLLVLPALILILAVIFWPEKIAPPPTPPKPPVILELADLIERPEWAGLDRFQNTISRETFLHRLTTIYTKSEVWKEWITIKNDHALIGDYKLQFAPSDQPPPGALWDWKASPDPKPGQPLHGLHIALDPGHIGGDYSQLEERHHEYPELHPDMPPIKEGSMTLATARLLKPLLESKGARVTLVRDKLEPTTPYSLRNFREARLFYRTSEIRARAKLLNEKIRPDLVICLHYNATSSKIPLPGQDFHIILNGTYSASELANEDERFAMLQRLLSGVIDEEIPLAAHIASVFSKKTGLPPYTYNRFSKTSQNVALNPFLWARNLLANRLYMCPVIFMEPYSMNSTEFIDRFQKNKQAIFEEYAGAVAEGIISYYARPQ
ncbi:MAG: N-acetylmuramoyl-L-alanine amidase [Akkermansiaceae bacterium]